MVDKMTKPLFSIGIISELLDIHPETLRVWEKHGIVKPIRRKGHRYYTDIDLKRLKFIKTLIHDNLNLPAIEFYLKLYPCWQMDTCPKCMHMSNVASCIKKCWKNEGYFCQVEPGEDTCSSCEHCSKTVLAGSSNDQ
jgi:MerR family transcriptional regulator, heat shock protein HspR